MSDRTEYHREYARKRRAADPERARGESSKAYEALKLREEADPSMREAREAKAAQWRKDHAAELEQARHDRWEATRADPVKLEHARKLARRGMRRYRGNPVNRPKMRARWILSKAVARGTIIKRPCEVCGSIRSEGHHFAGYAHPRVVQWLCRTHHQAVHHPR
jgi:hypothetical protein